MNIFNDAEINLKFDKFEQEDLFLSQQAICFLKELS